MVFMPELTSTPPKSPFPAILSWTRLKHTLWLATPLGLMLSISNSSPVYVVVVRAWITGFLALLFFGLCERWPKRLPDSVARWVWQLIGVLVAAPVGAFFAYVLTVHGDWYFWQSAPRMSGFLALCFAGIFFGPWFALIAMVRQREAFARHQALEFELQRSELQRQALDARMHLLQAQVQPHFLFNTLANIQALVLAGSPDAPKVLATLIAYLRAAVPRLQEPVSTLEQELQLVRAYLELMQMRMPDRLTYKLDVAADRLDIRCAPLTLLTLVENAVRHGIDPSEEGGHIEITVSVAGDDCIVTVSDTGVGLRQGQGGLGTGLPTLQERLRLIFGEQATLQLHEVEPHGVTVQVRFPVRMAMA